jgi:hypothetical protein
MQGIDSEVSWQQELVDKSLRMAATGLLSMADMRKLVSHALLVLVGQLMPQFGQV